MVAHLGQLAAQAKQDASDRLEFVDAQEASDSELLACADDATAAASYLDAEQFVFVDASPFYFDWTELDAEPINVYRDLDEFALFAASKELLHELSSGWQPLADGVELVVAHDSRNYGQSVGTDLLSPPLPRLSLRAPGAMVDSPELPLLDCERAPGVMVDTPELPLLDCERAPAAW